MCGGMHPTLVVAYGEGGVSAGPRVPHHGRWRGEPFISQEVVVNVIGHTTTNTGLTIQAEVDKNASPTGMKVSSEDMKRLNLSPAKFHGKDWNSAIKPHQQRA